MRNLLRLLLQLLTNDKDTIEYTKDTFMNITNEIYLITNDTDLTEDNIEGCTNDNWTEGSAMLAITNDEHPISYALSSEASVLL